MPRPFYAILANTVVASVTNTCVWFAVTFWVYLETQSVIATSIMAGLYLVAVAVSGIYLGSLVDRYLKKNVMMLSSAVTLGCFALAGLTYITAPAAEFHAASSVRLWAMVALVLAGGVAGNLRGIALSTIVTILIPEEGRDRANGLVGSANGVAFLVASILSGMVIGFVGVTWMLVGACALLLGVLLHLATLRIPELVRTQGEVQAEGIDLRGSLAAVQAVPGLLGLILFHTFNNFLGGVFMSLMDPYGLQLVSVQVWGVLWGILSLGFIVGGALFGITYPMFFPAISAQLKFGNITIPEAFDVNPWLFVLFTFLATASHGVLDAFTTGGLGVAFLWPWSPARFFAPVRGIRVSPMAQ